MKENSRIDILIKPNKTKQFHKIYTIARELHSANRAIILLAILTLASGCDSTVNTCRDYYGRRIGIQEAAVKLRINLKKQSEPVMGDGIAWGVVRDDIDRYCHVKK